jgi:hypothetical protein
MRRAVHDRIESRFCREADEDLIIAESDQIGPTA